MISIWISSPSEILKRELNCLLWKCYRHNFHHSYFLEQLQTFWTIICLLNIEHNEKSFATVDGAGDKGYVHKTGNFFIKNFVIFWPCEKYFLEKVQNPKLILLYQMRHSLGSVTRKTGNRHHGGFERSILFSQSVRC